MGTINYQISVSACQGAPGDVKQALSDSDSAEWSCPITFRLADYRVHVTETGGGLRLCQGKLMVWVSSITSGVTQQQKSGHIPGSYQV